LTAAPRAAAGTVAREDVEAREARDLAPCAARAAASRGRVHAEPEHPFRTAYMRDRDRVVHAKAFRLLEYKTQVFGNDEGDSYRTRLTHTMEVAQVARTAARALRLNEDLVEAVALSHDVGHPPFGHAGEEALDALLRGEGGFEHNEHGLRVVDVLERRYPGFRGINLSHEVRESFAAKSPRKEALGFPPGRATLEAQLVDVCDNLAYTAHDLDDGIAAGCLAPEDLADSSLWAEVHEAAAAACEGLPASGVASAAVKRVIDLCVSDLVEATSARVAAAGVASVDDVRATRLLVGFSPEVGRRQRELGRLLHERFYRHPRVLRMSRRATETVTALFERLVSDPSRLEPPWRAWADEVGVPRAVGDRIASMTDREALDRAAANRSG
jgi:dGTPase